MKFAIIKERKTPPDRRVVFSPAALLRLKEDYPQIEIKIESSDIRLFSDAEYIAAGFEVTTDVSDCDVFLGVKEVPVSALIPGKKYFFFSHTIKKQAHNQKMLQAVIDKEIDLYDHETIVDANNKRLIGFGRYAGIVGAYNGFRAFGNKFELFHLPKAELLKDKDALVEKLNRVILPNLKIVLTGHGKVAQGAKEMLVAMKIKEVGVTDFLSKKYDSPVFTQIDVTDYYKKADGSAFSKQDFYAHPEKFVSDFKRFANVSDVFIAGHFYGNGAPVILSREMLLDASAKIKIVADISCDVAGPIDSTLRPSTIADPFYGYLASTGQEVDFYHPGAIGVMAIDNLPCELPRDASEGFGEMFLTHVIPAFFNGDAYGVLQRARITHKGKLEPRFEYLEDFVNEKKLESVPQ